MLGFLGAGFLCPPYLDAASITDRALTWLETAPQPFFLWLHYMDAHWPYHLQSCRFFSPTHPHARLYSATFARRSRRHPTRVTEKERQGLLERYRSGARFATDQAGRLLETLRERGRFDNTLVVVTSDHGESFGEHGEFYHGKVLYEENIRVPLVVKLPGQQESRVLHW